MHKPENEMLDTWIPESIADWNQWLLREERKTIAAYREKPSLLIADYRREKDIARDYEGREILELLQNSNDQAAEMGLRGRVLIELSQNGLIVSNSGLPFCVGGVVSLETSHLSPKRRRRRELIGNKGLGFRSVLNWSRRPIILSGKLRLAYSDEYARAKLNSLTGENSTIARLVKEEQQNGDAPILPRLSFPAYSVDGNLRNFLEDELASRLLERCEALLIEGYDTVIGMPFDTPTGHDAASAQISNFRPEILLFAQHIGELAFSQDGTGYTVWRREDGPDSAEVLANGDSLGKWRIYRIAEKLPEAIATEERNEAADYEIVVAVPKGTSCDPGPLYSHFPTDISFPLPLVCHATLELEQNRKHLQQGRRCNAHVLGRVAEILVEIAERMALEAGDDPWSGCSLVMAKADYPADLIRTGFPNKLLESVKTRRIIPTLAGEPTVPASARLIPGANPSWLPPELFPEVVPIRTAEDLRFLSTLGVPSLEIAEIKKRIIADKNLTLDQQIALIIGLLNQPSLKEAYTSALVLDSGGSRLGDGVRIFLPPTGGEIPKLPNWADLRFLHQDMREKLTERLRSRDVREFQQKLSGFGILEYSLANVIRALIAEANRAAKNDPVNAEVYEADLVTAVFGLYMAEGRSVKRPDYPEQSPLYLRSQSGTAVAATALYFAAGFGTHGEIMQSLYGSWAPEKLVDIRRVQGLTNDIEVLRRFLIWIGVAPWPRIIDEGKADSRFCQQVLRAIKYPARFEEKLVTSPDEARGPFLSAVQSIDGLDKILSEAESAAVVAWLVNDERAAEWARQSPGHAELKAYPHGVNKARTYQGPLPSYIRWRLETTAWLRSIVGRALSPRDCVLGERALEELFPRPAMPEEPTIERYGLQQRDVIEGWRRAGVLASFAYLERDEIYAKLLELPERSPDGKLARPLYHWLLDASEVALGGDGPNQKEFLSRGKMWGHHGSIQSYFPVAELRHVDSEGVPEALLQQLNIVDLRKRVGSEKVERLFGVAAVDKAGIHRRVIDKEIAVGSSGANVDFQAAKPYLHKLRASQTSQLIQLQALKDLTLEVCSSLHAELVFEGRPVEYKIDVWDWLIADSTIYIRSDPAKPLAVSESLLSDAIGQALASVFRLADGGDFARLLACKEGDRLTLLQRILGEPVKGDVDALKAEYASFDSRPSVPVTFPVTPAPRIDSASDTAEPPPPVESSEPNADNPGRSPEPHGLLQVIEEQHTPQPPSQPKKLQVKTVTSPGGGVGSSHRVTDGDFCERKAMEFEEAADPPRWPLAAGHIVGAQGPGCDILSFATEEERKAFETGQTRDLNTVVRFVEVKGRGSSEATIELKGNELSAAERYAERYFLYRLFETEDGDYELTVLQNPLIHKEALRAAVHVDMKCAPATRRFSLMGGLKKD
jgi:hypothetical protein